MENYYINTTEQEIPKNYAKDFDDELDDIFNNLGTLSNSNGSFDSPININRHTKFFKDFAKDISSPSPLRKSISNKNINFKPNIKTINEGKKQEKILKIKNNNISNTKQRKNSGNVGLKTASNKKNNIWTPKNNKNDINSLENLNNIFCKTFDDGFGVNKKDKNLPIINKKMKNKNIKDNEIIINEQIEKIISLIKEMKEIDNKLKKKDLKKMLKNLINDINNNSFYDSLNQILEYLIDILNSIKFNKNKNDNKIGNEKIITKLKK